MLNNNTLSANKHLINEVKILKEDIDRASKPDNPLANLGNMKKEGYNLSDTLEQNYLFNQPGPFGMNWGFIPEGIVSMLVSPGGCGKTYALLQAAVSLATGKKWLDTFLPTKIGKSLVVLAEEGRVFAHNRMKYIVDCLGLSKEYLERVYSNIHLLPMSGGLCRFTDAKGKPTDNLKYFKEYLENHPDIKLVILDPASRFLGPNCEIDNAAATDWVASINELSQIKSSPTIIVSHHANKSAIRPVNGSKDVIFDQSITRGASGLVDGVRLVLGMQKKEQDQKTSIIFKIFKTNVCDTGEAVELVANRKYGGVLELNKHTNKDNNKYSDERYSHQDTSDNYGA
jgi:RecA-family ATPase